MGEVIVALLVVGLMAGEWAAADPAPAPIIFLIQAQKGAYHSGHPASMFSNNSATLSMKLVLTILFLTH